MDATSNEKKKLLNGQKNNEAEDRISFLPEAILLHILSMLPTVDVVRTSELSTTWRYLWTLVPNYEFDDRESYFSKWCVNMDTKRRFMNFVDRVLHLSDVTNIQKFSLSCGGDHDTSRLNAWISTVLKRYVQELILDFVVNDSNLLPRRLFICDTLTTLKINAGFGLLNIPNVICLLSLKVLHLNIITFICDHTSQQVYFHLPTLKEFVLDNCQWVKIKVVNIFVPTLEEWTMDDYACSSDEACEIKVYAESLTSLNLETNLANELSLYNLSSLNTACINVFSYDNIGHHAGKLLKAVCNVRDLTLHDPAVWGLCCTGFYAQWLTFSSLVNLKVIVDRTQCFEGKVLISVRKLVDLLIHLPNIAYFFFSSRCDCFEEDEDGWTIEAIPQSVLSRLKSVEVENFYGTKNELYLVEVLLKIARALVKITIKSSPALLKDPKKQIEVVKQLLGAPRISTCVINFT